MTESDDGLEERVVEAALLFQRLAGANREKHDSEPNQDYLLNVAAAYEDAARHLERDVLEAEAGSIRNDTGAGEHADRD